MSAKETVGSARTSSSRSPNGHAGGNAVRRNTDEIAVILRAMVTHETEQVHRRLSWLGTFQGFLFAGLGFAWGKNKPILLLIAFLGLSISILLFVSLVAATLAIERIRAYWRAHRPDDYEGPDILGFYPDRMAWTVYTAPENLIPLVFAIAWGVVLWIV